MVSKDLQITHKIHFTSNRFGVNECETVLSTFFVIV